MKTITTTLLALGLTFKSFAGDPPTPKPGYRWVINDEYSDEFNGTELDKSKWSDTFKGWKGRKPAKFVSKTVSVKDGAMQIKNGVLENDKDGYTIAGGAVQSKKETAHFGYYECNFQASRINMSTTFWMSNSKQYVDYITEKSNGENCAKDRYSQELDICESIGGNFNKNMDKFRTKMNFNTHYRYVDCEGGREKFYSAGNNAMEGNGQKSSAELDSESWQEYHTYGAYWKNANEVSFYADNRFVGDVKVKTDVVEKPFDRAMKINMVTETYNWVKPIPTVEELNNDKINTSYYNWIRSYKLIPIDQKHTSNYDPIFKDEAFFVYDPIIKTSSKVNVFFSYKTNSDATILLKVLDLDNNTVSTSTKNVLAGFGTIVEKFKLDKRISPSKKYKFNIEVVKQ